MRRFFVLSSMLSMLIGKVGKRSEKVRKQTGRVANLYVEAFVLCGRVRSLNREAEDFNDEVYDLSGKD